VASKNFIAIKNSLGAQSITFLNQVHGINGFCVKTSSKSLELRERDGDFLVTKERGVAIGVLTADCLPIVLFDKKNCGVGVVHAGWRGSVKNISLKALEMMQKEFGTNPADVIAYFGPSARVCCYEVGRDFEVSALCERGNKFFFDNTNFNYLQLLEAGVLEENIEKKYNLCTICSELYHSYRRDRDRSGRQATVVVLR